MYARYTDLACLQYYRVPGPGDHLKVTGAHIQAAYRADCSPGQSDYASFEAELSINTRIGGIMSPSHMFLQIYQKRWRAASLLLR